MINYSPLWQTMRQRDVSTYTLIHKYGINPRTINNLKHNKSITMFTLERLCEILNCEPNDIIRFEKEEEKCFNASHQAKSINLLVIEILLVMILLNANYFYRLSYYIYSSLLFTTQIFLRGINSLISSSIWS